MVVKLSYRKNLVVFVKLILSNTTLIFQLMIFITTYKILRFIQLFPWITSKLQCRYLLVNYYIICSNLFIPAVYDFQVNYNM